MKSIIVKRPIPYVKQRKVKAGIKINLTPRNRYLLSLCDESLIVPVDFSLSDLLAELRKETEEWHKNLQLWGNIKNTPGSPLQITPKLTLEPYQQIGLSMMFILNRGLLLMEQGTGKTPVALAALYYRRNVSTLVVCPLPVRYEWAMMIDAFELNIPYEIIQSSKSFTPEKGKVYFVGYQRFLMLDHTKLKFDQIIYDEVHKLKSHTSSTNKTAYLFGTNAEYVYGLSGTPYGNNLTDIFGICKPIEERLYGVSIGVFEEMYTEQMTAKNKEGTKYNKVIGFKNVDHLKALLEMISYRKRKQEVLTLPPQIDLTLTVDNTPEYKELKTEMMLEINDDVVVVDRRLNLPAKLQQVCSGYVHGENGWHIINRNKINKLMEYLEENEDQIVIYVTYDMSEAMIREEFDKRGYKYSVVSGGNKDNELSKKLFKTKQVQYIIIKYASGTEGMNFQANCHKMVFYDITPSHIDYSQARDRIHRKGQHASEVLYIHMITKNSVEEKVLKVIQNHQDFAEYLLDGGEI